MWAQLFGGVLISLINFTIHAICTAVVVYSTRHMARATSERGLLVRLLALLTVTMVSLMIAHVLEIAIWTAYYIHVGLVVSNASPFEFAFENYTALGYGDAVPGEGARLLGPITALNGLLLVGWSVAIIFEVMRMAELQFGYRGKA